MVYNMDVMRETTYKEIKNCCPDALLIDVREVYEYEAGNLGGKNIPMSELQTRIHEIPKDRDVILYCRTGSRSNYTIQILSQMG